MLTKKNKIDLILLTLEIISCLILTIITLRISIIAVINENDDLCLLSAFIFLILALIIHFYIEPKKSKLFKELK